MNNPIRIALLDKQNLFRQSLELMLNIEANREVVLSLSGMDALIDSLYLPDIEMIDLLIVDVGHLDEHEWLKLGVLLRRFPAIRAMALTAKVDRNTFFQLVGNGVSAYYSKDTDAVTLTEAIDRISANGNSPDLLLGKSVRNKLTGNDLQPPKQKVSFSRREVQILELVCREYSNREIAEKLKLDKRTVETHRSRMIKRTNSKSILGVVIYAIDEMYLPYPKRRHEKRQAVAANTEHSVPARNENF